MTTVLIHNIHHVNEREARAANRTRADVTSESYWNLWKRALPPFNDLHDGADILLLESWPGGGRFSWHVRAGDVITKRVADKYEAIAQIAAKKGETPDWVLGNEYTYERPDDVKALIFWNAIPVRRLDLPKPAGLRVGRNGWLVTDSATLAGLGVSLGQSLRKHSPGNAKKTGGRSGQGRRLDVDAKNAVEKHAEDLAEAWCRQQGWREIKRVGSTKSWDLEATDPVGQVRQVEVKGTTGGVGDVEVTSGEVNAALRHGQSHALFVVYRIELNLQGAKWATRGGTARVFDPWSPRQDELDPTKYRWKTKRRGSTYSRERSKGGLQ